MSLIYCFENYTSKVFKLPYLLSLLEDSRKNPYIDIKNIFIGYYYSSAFRIKATSEVEEETRKGILKKRVGNMSDDTIGYGLNNLEVNSTQRVWYMLSKAAKRNGMLRESLFNDYIVGVLDGIEIYSSYKRHCDKCLTRKVQTSKKELIQYYHRAVVLILFGYDFPVPIGMEMVRRGEDEVACGLRLLKRIVKQLGKRFIDIVIGDALYCRANFFNECEKLGVIPGAVLKGNQINLLESAKSLKKLTEPVTKLEEDKEKLKLWDLKEVFWETADKDVRVIWAEREILDRGEDSGDKSFQWIEKKNVFAFSKKIDHVPANVLYSIGRHRWDIDSKIFMDMVKHWHLKHKTLHFEKAYENMLSIKLIAYFIFMFFFFRHINSRRKNKIKSYIQMARILYRSACNNLKPQIILLE